MDRREDVTWLRDRLNLLVLVLPGQWFGLMAIFWLRFVPAFRPYAFLTPPPPAWAVVLCVAVCLLPCVLPRAWFRLREFERGSFYPSLGVRLFRYLAPDGDLVNKRLRRLAPSYRRVRTRAALVEHLQGTYANERAHLVLLLMGTCTQVFAFWTGQIAMATALTIANIAFNLYPVMHQRYKRARARRTLARLDQRPDTGSLIGA